MMDCPTCETTTDTEHGLKIHHKQVHGESLVGKSECKECGSHFCSPPSHDAKFCSQDCYTAWQSGHKASIVCEWCGDEKGVPPERVSRMRFCSTVCYHEARAEWITGSGNPNWKGGSHRYYGENWLKERGKALERDGGECRWCGTQKRLEVHHIIPIRMFGEPEWGNFQANLLTLCATHHRKLEGESYKQTMRKIGKTL